MPWAGMVRMGEVIGGSPAGSDRPTGGVAIRVDGSRELGLGHIVRCLSLALALKIELGKKQRPVSISFVCREDEGARNVLERSEFKDSIRWISRDGDDLSEFGAILRELRPRVVVTDINLAGRVDEYLETIYPAAHVSIHERNYHLLAGDKVIAPTIRPLQHSEDGAPGMVNFIGPEYVLLAPDIPERRKRAPAPKDPPGMILVSMGGGDPTRLTLKVAGAIRAYKDPRIDWKVILGPASGYDKWELVREFPGRIDFLPGGDLDRGDFLGLVESSDVVITNGATTLYESLALGRPSIAIPQGDFEAVVVSFLVEAGACVTPREGTSPGILESLSGFLEDSSLRKRVSARGKELIDGEGALRVARMIVELVGGATACRP